MDHDDAGGHVDANGLQRRETHPARARRDLWPRRDGGWTPARGARGRERHARLRRSQGAVSSGRARDRTPGVRATQCSSAS